MSDKSANGISTRSDRLTGDAKHGNRIVNSGLADPVERAAFAIYRTFIRQAAGTRRWKRDENGDVIRGKDGRMVAETLDEAAWRRWCAASELTRDRFREEASAVLEAA